MIKRKIADKLVGLAETFPVVTIEGPRQSGKTTLARMTFPGHAYANLEESATRALAEGDPRGFLARFPAPAIIDEIQRVPQLLSEIDGVEGLENVIIIGASNRVCSIGHTGDLDAHYGLILWFSWGNKNVVNHNV